MSGTNAVDQKWTTIITSKKKRFRLGLKDLIDYRDLILLFFKRDFTTFYKQTILGPAWYLVQSIFTTIVFGFIFNRVAGLSTEGVPPYLFYLCGITLWTLFKNILVKSSNTFLENSNLFGKVYFPRIAAPFASVGAELVGLCIQILLFTGLYLYFLFTGMPVAIHWSLALFPVLVLQVVMMALGFGLIVSSMTTKYRDLKFLVSFIMQLWMYGSPVAYALSELSGKVPEFIRWAMWINPISFSLELLRFMLFQSNTIDWNQGLVSIGITLVLFVLGITNFNRVERDFMDRI